MENTNKRYWRGIEEFKNDAEFVKNAHREFGDAPSDNQEEGAIFDGTGSHRRDFLKVLGFGVSAVALAACEAPVKKTIPYLNKPEDVEPTIANWYASSFVDGGDYASVLVKTREGRPIKLEGNKASSVSLGGLSARAQASVLSLYDNEKLKGPQVEGKAAEWSSVDKAIVAELAKVAASGKAIRIVSNTILSPTTKKVIGDFIAKYPTTTLVTYDANSLSGLVQANGGSIPSYDFSKAKTIVSLGADFLGSWISPTTFAAQWAKTRRVSSVKGGNKEMSRHYQFETIMSNTGANADFRATYKPSQEGLVVAALYNAIAAKVGANVIAVPAVKIDHLEKAAADLVATKGASIVVSGSNDPAVQSLVVSINALIGAYGTTISGASLNYRQGSDAAMNAFINEAKAGQVGAVIFYNANPVYNHPRGAELAEALPKIGLTISFNDRADETGSLCKFNAPDSHYLESWNDAEPKAGFYSLTQPTISTIFKTRQAQASLLTWAGLNADYASYLEANWSSSILKGGKLAWTQVLHDGVYEPNASQGFNVPQVGIAEAAASIAKTYKASSDKLELAIYEKVGMGTGSQANNPWLQEFPEPVSKATWGNYATVSLATAKKLALEQEVELDTLEVEITVGGKSVKLPFIVQPGQASDTVAIAIGYGRTKAGKSADGVGVNVYPFTTMVNGTISFSNTDVQVKATGEKAKIARTQTHNTVMAREAVVQETTLSAYVKDVEAGRFKPEIETAAGRKSATEVSIWNGHTYNNHHWGMVIDLNTCTGCSACVVACTSENNVPVVGRQEVINRREMHWMRIDRYYSSDADANHEELGLIAGPAALEHASENPQVVFQPMLCQHCDNAPCETVCPVLATTHSSEGLNQMTYNRCIGTRYCANNCPYKVRRFNWFRYFQTDDFDFNLNNDLGRMVLNPDVTVRSRGVMEKCSMCVQRIQAGKLEAKKEKRRPKDGEIQVACAQSCPTNAITFGDKNDPTSAISKLLAEEKVGRSFRVIEEINVSPNINYLVKVRNNESAAKGEAKAEAKKEHEHA
ncbi:MAG: TAT-variant-translocated molybdopterin oxidoreductase [Spirosomataceae bacterium]